MSQKRIGLQLLWSLCASFGIFLFLPIAHAGMPEMEVGAFVGGHFFSPDIGLGRDYVPFHYYNQIQHGVVVGPRFSVGLHPHFALEAEVGFVPTTTVTGLARAFVLDWRMHGLVHILTGKIRPFVTFGLGGLSLFSTNHARLHDDTDLELHAGIGSKFDVYKNFGLRLDGRVIFAYGRNGNPAFAVTPYPNFEALIGAYWRFGGSPQAHLTPDLPAPTADNYEPKDVAKPKKKSGKDFDKDGIDDSIDKCPTLPEDKDGFEDEDGCPDPDNDKDGISDENDRCPNDPEDIDGFEDNDGCPDPDNDKDGILDVADACPNEPETINNFKDEDGCPDDITAIAKGEAVKLEVYFDTNQSKIKAQYAKTLKDAAVYLKKDTQARYRISGHTDNVGAAKKNIKLSQNRANAIKAFLVKAGVKSVQLEAVGRGPNEPIAPNDTEDGKAKNRRVEIQKIK